MSVLLIVENRIVFGPLEEGEAAEECFARVVAAVAPNKVRIAVRSMRDPETVEQVLGE